MPIPLAAAVLGGAGLSAAANIFGGRSAQRSQERLAGQNIALQREFAQHGIRWKVADAKAAGIHPLYALGAQVPSYSPVTADLGHAGRGYGAAGASMGSALARMGQAPANPLAALQLERAGLENDLLRVQIMNEGQRFAQKQGVPGDKPIPIHRKYVDRYGNVSWGLNPDAEPLQEPEAGVMHGLYTLDQNIEQLLKKYFGPAGQMYFWPRHKFKKRIPHYKKSPRNPAHRRRYPQ